jgi:predicted dinucleotide-binding enzyme
MNDIAIIGAGKVGTVLGRGLSQAGYRIIALTCSRVSSARKSQKIIGQGTAYADNIQASREADVVILAVQDMQISRISEELSKSDIRWDGKYVFHCSGLLEPI